MSNKRQHDAWQEEQSLSDSGYMIEGRRCVRFHAADETLKHRTAKLASAHVLHEEGYRVESEVEQTDGPIADILAYGHEDRKPIVVELESDCTDSLKRENARRYTVGIVRECFTIDVEELPWDIGGMIDDISREVVR
jgi:hypothetical protein